MKKIQDYDANIDLSKHSKRINELSKEWAILAYRSRMGIFDVIEVLLKAHAVLNDRIEICEDDFEFLKMVEPLIIDKTAPHQHEILKMYLKGSSHREICAGLQKEEESYKSYVSKVIHTAIERGIICKMKPFEAEIEQEVGEEHE